MHRAYVTLKGLICQHGKSTVGDTACTVARAESEKMIQCRNCLLMLKCHVGPDSGTHDGEAVSNVATLALALAVLDDCHEIPNALVTGLGLSLAQKRREV